MNFSLKNIADRHVRSFLGIPLCLAFFVSAPSLAHEDQGQRVDSAIEALKSGNSEPLTKLTDTGAVGPLSFYLRSDDEAVRRAALGQMTVIGDLSACRALVPALADESFDIRERAAARLYACRREFPEKDLAIAGFAQQAVDMGTASAQTFFLFGESQSDDAVSKLETVADLNSDYGMVKLASHFRPVPASYAAAVALEKLGRPDRLRDLSGAPDTSGAVFLLNVLSEISDPTILKTLAGQLDNPTEIAGGVPSHALPKRRVSDLAVDVFASRLDLTYGFQLTPAQRYDDQALAEAKAAILAAISRE